MFGDLFFSAALAIGQVPMPAAEPLTIPLVVPGSPVVRASMQPPPSMPPIPDSFKPDGVPLGTPLPAVNTETPSDAQADPSDPEPPPGLFMKVVDGTALGTLLSNSKTTISGFVDLRYTAANVNKRNIPAGNGFSFNPDLPQFVWLTVDRAVDKKSDAPSYGYHFDTIVYGSMYQYTTQRGLFNHQLTARNGSPNYYGVDPVQAYGEVYLPNVAKGMDIKVGRVFARFGVESLNPSLSVLPSYSYAFTYNPYTYTGVTTDTKLTDKLTVSNDFYAGNDVFLNNNSRFTWLGAAQYDFTDKTSVRAATIQGNNGYQRGTGYGNQSLFDVVLTHKFTDKLTYNFEYLYGWLRNAPGANDRDRFGPSIGDAHWQHYVNYLTYSWNDKHATTGRVEFFEDADGNRTGTRGLYTSYTLGHTWNPKSWLMIRPEVRYDHNKNAPFDGRQDFFGFTINGILKF
jgi:hypothetical protein